MIITWTGHLIEKMGPFCLQTNRSIIFITKRTHFLNQMSSSSNNHFRIYLTCKKLRDSYVQHICSSLCSYSSDEKVGMMWLSIRVDFKVIFILKEHRLSKTQPRETEPPVPPKFDQRRSETFCGIITSFCVSLIDSLVSGALHSRFNLKVDWLNRNQSWHV